MTINLPSSPTRADLSLIIRWIEESRTVLEGAFNFGVDSIRLKPLFNEPPKPRSGDIVFVATVAAGSNWDPDSSGNGGFFGYYGGAWNKLG